MKSNTESTFIGLCKGYEDKDDVSVCVDLPQSQT